MRVSLALTGIAALALASCGGAPKEGGDAPPATTLTTNGDTTNLSRSDSAAVKEGEAPATPDPLAPIDRESDASPPDISPDAAPDVAFGYRYSFGLAADSIAPVQQRHARLCEELGAARCRVTGMSYDGDERDVRAELRLAVEPGLAHRFGERALDSVRDAEGRLLDSQVTGRDVGSGIRASTRTIAELEEQLAELEARIARGGRTGTIRDLNAEAATLRARLQQLRGSRTQAREELATTPVILSYRSGAFAGRPDFGGALASAWEQAGWLAYGLFMIAVMLSPWLLGAGLIWLAVRALRRRREARGGAAA